MGLAGLYATRPASEKPIIETVAFVAAARLVATTVSCSRSR